MSARNLILPALLATALGSNTAFAEPVRVTKDDCRYLVEHHPEPDVAYREGVDVRGRPVAPADLPGSRRIQLRDSYVFDIEVRPFATDRRLNQRRLNQRDLNDGDRDRDERGRVRRTPLRDLARATSLAVGTVEVTPEGRVYFDGVALHDETQRALAEACREVVR